MHIFSLRILEIPKWWVTKHNKDMIGNDFTHMWDSGLFFWNVQPLVSWRFSPWEGKERAAFPLVIVHVQGQIPSGYQSNMALENRGDVLMGKSGPCRGCSSKKKNSNQGTPPSRANHRNHD